MFTASDGELSFVVPDWEDVSLLLAALTEARVQAQRVPGLEKALSDECANSLRLVREQGDPERAPLRLLP